MRRKILIVCGQLALGGAERELVTFLAAVRGGPWEFRVACLNEGANSVRMSNGFPVTRFKRLVLDPAGCVYAGCGV